ncbi:hypothetical protein BSL78_21304 [Apostichopus japonicus]|uniref:Ig-like domain-containing protein n=1 Tax=Stichopus japonicus TaxID=307972 RepID=A0A2G8K1K0_STIJA|nr:hypothetical protein BSL78_21304 [Apostichopus japonicus]
MDSLSVGIWIAYSRRNFSSLAVNGQLRTDLNRAKYSLTVNRRRNVLTIRGVSMTDSALYGCTIRIPVEVFCYSWRRCYDIWILKYTLFLDVVAENVQNCTFASNGIFGTYFTGDDILLSCPNADDISLSIRNVTSGMINIPLNMVTKEAVGDNIHLIKILSINTSLNGTKLVCMNTENTIDLCENLPVITVYKELMATVTPNSVEVPDGGSTELTCLSNLHDVVSFEFDIQYTNVTVGNVSMSKVPGGMKVTITEINFQLDVASSGLVVSCNVTFGTRYAFGNASIKLIKEGLTSKAVIIALPIVFAMIIICTCVIVIIFLYYKSSRKGKPNLKQKDISRNEAKANDQNMADHSYYYMEPKSGGKGGVDLAQTDSAIVDNVAYVSYESGRG